MEPRAGSRPCGVVITAGSTVLRLHRAARRRPCGSMRRRSCRGPRPTRPPGRPPRGGDAGNELDRTAGAIEWLSRTLDRFPEPPGAWLNVFLAERAHLGRIADRLLTHQSR